MVRLKSRQPDNAQIKKGPKNLLRGLTFHPEGDGGQRMDVKRRDGVIVLKYVCKVCGTVVTLEN